MKENFKHRFKNLFSFKGRISAKECEHTYLATLVWFLIAMYPIAYHLTNPRWIISDTILFSTLGIISLGVLWINMAQFIKRFNDLGIKNNFWKIIVFYSGVFLFVEGQDCENEHGQAPDGSKSIKDISNKSYRHVEVWKNYFNKIV